MKKVIIISLVIIFCSGCTLIKGGKEFEEFVRTVQENVHRYKK